MLLNLFPVRTYKSKINSKELEDIKSSLFDFIKYNQDNFIAQPNWHGDTITDYPMTKFKNKSLKSVILKNAFLYFRLIDNKSKIPKVKILNLWVNINKKGTYQEEHRHIGLPFMHFSGTLYISNKNEGGDFEFINPNYLNYTIPPRDLQNFRIKASEGTILLFPYYMPHKVYPHTGSSDRISISFNYIFDFQHLEDERHDFWKNYKMEDVAPYNM